MSWKTFSIAQLGPEDHIFTIFRTGRQFIGLASYANETKNDL